MYEGVSKSFRTGLLERELQIVQLSATRCSCIAILWVSPVSFATINLCVASQRVFIVKSIYFVIDSVHKLLDTSSYINSKGVLFDGDLSVNVNETRFYILHATGSVNQPCHSTEFVYIASGRVLTTASLGCHVIHKKVLYNAINDALYTPLCRATCVAPIPEQYTTDVKGGNHYNCGCASSRPALLPAAVHRPNNIHLSTAHATRLELLWAWTGHA
jgi:hypothetical protein